MALIFSEGLEFVGESAEDVARARREWEEAAVRNWESTPTISSLESLLINGTRDAMLSDRDTRCSINLLATFASYELYPVPYSPQEWRVKVIPHPEKED